jgi:type IV pilus assembly protein PilA
MKSVFTAKYLQHLNSKKNKDGGFTLIELLVVIIIVGVLAAIALPSFLNQIGKARGSEAKSTIGTINRSQQSYRLENNQFSDDIVNLDAQVNGKFYTYAINDADQNWAAVQTTATQDDLKVYSAYVSQTADQFDQTICESNDTAENGDDSTPMDDGSFTCDDISYKEVQ